jgi:lipopolysaccharide/colanic/teichoic acid biosynthesis glycosyltransferase
LIKRTLDILLSGITLVVFSFPLFVIVCIVRVNLGSPVFFHQVRPGLNGKSFKMIKFRTMTNASAPNGELLADTERLTSVGGFLRSTSLDELPELWNVIRGDMSLVGPRPLLLEYLPLYSEEQSKRHDVRPGITGWAQVNGRNTLSWEDKFSLDVWYTENRSVWLDMKILFLTVKQVFSRRGINAAGEATMSKFRGSQ